MRIRSAITLLMFLAGLNMAAPVQAQTDFTGQLAVLGAAHQKLPSPVRVADLLRRCAQELDVADRPMPRVVLLQTGKEEAKIADVAGWGHVFVEFHPNSGETIYMAWIQGEATDAGLAMVLTGILNDSLSLHLSERDLQGAVRRVLLRSSATTSVDALIAHHR